MNSAVLTRSLRAKALGSVRRSRSLRWLAAIIVLLAVLAFGTKFVSDTSKLASGPQQFSPTQFAAANFGKIQAAIVKRAVPATTLAAALHQNQATATRKYGEPNPGAAGPEFSVNFTGVAGGFADGIYTVTVPGTPKGLVIRVQVGPAINGTDLRDATGKYPFGSFVDQIAYQNAAAALNTEMKKVVLASIDVAHLSGKTVSVVGAFQLINPDGWLVTPVRLAVA